MILKMIAEAIEIHTQPLDDPIVSSTQLQT
jgi:hypothetical protein